MPAPASWSSDMPANSLVKLLDCVRCPVLVIHGDEDNLIQSSGGERTAQSVPGARLELIEGMGHDLAEPLWPSITGLLLDHARSAGGDSA